MRYPTHLLFFNVTHFIYFHIIMRYSTLTHPTVTHRQYYRELREFPSFHNRSEKGPEQ